ncbi:MAG: 1-deoxy-D-xylulose-5-phosphate synthase, partial [Lachnospiraceae bacterium]|nr:1-deoxy-D-xylulose-5-phosphate synthase [Lachnospiraceae bacterium]
KPIDEEALKKAAETHSLIVTMEENVASGGYGEKVREYLDSIQAECKVLTVAIPDKFVEHGSVDQLYKEIGMDADSVAARIKECI